MLKLKLQYFGHLMWRADSLEKTLMLGKIEGRRRGWQRMTWLDGITNSMDMSFSNLQELVMDREAWSCSCSPWGRKESNMTEWLNWTEKIFFSLIMVQYALCLLGPVKTSYGLQLSGLSVFFRGGPWGRQLEGGPASWMIPASQHSGPVHLPALGGGQSWLISDEENTAKAMRWHFWD